MVPGRTPTAEIVAALPELLVYENEPPLGWMEEDWPELPVPPAAEASATAPMPPVVALELVMAIACDTDVSGPVGLTTVWAMARPQPTKIAQPPETLMPEPVPLDGAWSEARVWLLAMEPPVAWETDRALAPPCVLKAMEPEIAWLPVPLACETD